MFLEISKRHFVISTQSYYYKNSLFLFCINCLKPKLREWIAYLIANISQIGTTANTTFLQWILQILSVCVAEDLLLKWSP